MPIGYESLKQAYMESKQTTLKQLAADNEIPYADLKKYACENGWYAQKRRALKKAREKTKPFENTKLSQAEKINEIAEKLLENIRLSSDVTDKPTSIYNLTSALKNVTAVLRDVNELPNWKDRQSAEMAQLKLELAKNKTETGEPEQSGGVVMLPEVKCEQARNEE